MLDSRSKIGFLGGTRSSRHIFDPNPTDNLDVISVLCYKNMKSLIYISCTIEALGGGNTRDFIHATIISYLKNK